MRENNEQSRGGAGRCVRTERCGGRCGETALDSDHVHDLEVWFTMSQIEVVLHVEDGVRYIVSVVQNVVHIYQHKERRDRV